MPGVQTETRAPYASILGDAYARLDPMVRLAHEAPLSARGTLTVAHGDRWWTPGLVRMMRLPAAGLGQPVRLELSASGTALTWSRQIGASPLRTTQQAENARLVERCGIGRLTFALSVRQGSLVYRQEAFHIMRVRIPDPFSPRVHAAVSAAQDGWSVWVEVTWRGILVCRYAGIITAV